MAQVDAQYVIDIAAQMDGGESTIAELDRLTATLTGSGKNAEFFQQAIKKVSADLQTAAAASASAAETLAAGNSRYAELEQAATQAAKAVEKVGKSGGTMSREYVEAAQKSHDAAVALDEQAAALLGLERNAKKAAEEEAKLSQTFGNVKKLSGHADKSFAAQGESLEKLSSGIGAIPGPIGNLGQSLLKPIQGFTKLSASMGESNAAMLLVAAGAAAVVIAVVALSVALAVGVVKVAAWAVGLADAAKSAELASEAFNILNPEVSFLAPKIDELAGNTTVAKKDLQGLAAQLSEAGVSADNLSNALEAAALAESSGGKGASAKYVALEKAAGDARKAVDDFAKKSGGAVSSELTAKLNEAEQAAADFAGRAKATRSIVDKQLASTGKQTERLEKNFNELFSGLNTEPVERALKIIADLFDQNTESGRAMKKLFEEVFQPIIDQAENAAVAVEAFVLGFLIGVMKLWIKVKPIIRDLGEFFGFEDTSTSDTLDMIAEAAEFLAPVILFLVAQFVAAAAIVLGLVAALGALVVGIAAIPVIIIEAGVAIGEFFVGMVKDAVNFFTETDWTKLGTDLVQGLINGVVNMGAKFIGAITGLVSNAIGAAKSLLGIHSPSKVFEEFGDMTGEGFVQGVEAQNDNAQGAMSEMVEPELPAQPFAGVNSGNTGGVPGDAAEAPVGGGSSGVASVTVQGNTFIFQGVKDAEHAQALFEESMTKLLKGDAASLGNSVEEKGKAA